MINILESLNARGITLIVVTHDPEIGERAQRRIQMRDGRVETDTREENLVVYDDVTRFAWRALRGYPTRTVLMLIAMAIGVAAVVVLTSLGEGARRYVTDEFLCLAPIW